MTETRTLLLTDVVDSTTLSESFGDEAMADLWARHDRVARDLLVVHDGVEIDKTDGFLMLFRSAADGVAYAVAYHAALDALGIAARAGLHVGPVILTANLPADVARGAKPLEVDGIAKPTAARVMSVARGRQTLLTAAAVEALGPTALRLQSHGHWRMKGVSEPIELFEVGDEDAPFTPPPDGSKVYRVVCTDGAWVPLREVPHNLPAERDAFLGRSSDLKTLADTVEASRLVSVHGIGGTGKTRLVTRFGRTWMGDFPGGVWFCDLSEARTADDVAASVARSLDVRPGKGDLRDQAARAIAGRGPCLVILDNFEQVAAFARQTLGAWLDAAPQARFVVTTREVLGLAGEGVVPLAPLAVEESIALFTARARQARPSFEPTDGDAIEALVRLLDGLPLAIELAAARVRVMPPATLLARMSQRFELLATRGARRPRQATLRGALDWSWELLDTEEQSALAQLSVFEGGFGLEAAEAVLALDTLWGVDAVQAMVDKSLVRQVGEDRFDMLMSVKEYAAQKLDAQGDRPAVEARHGAFFAAMDREHVLWEDGGTGLAELAAELYNLVAACRRAAARGDGSIAVGALRATWVGARRQGPFALGVELSTAVLGLSLEPLEEAWVRRVRGQAAFASGDLDAAVVDLDAALTLGQGSAQLVAEVHHALGNVYANQRKLVEARGHYEVALAGYRATGHRHLECNILAELGVLDTLASCWDDARTRLVDARRKARELESRGLEARALLGLAMLCGSTGEPDRAAAHYGDLVAICRENRQRTALASALNNLGSLHLLQGRLPEARSHLEEALAVSRQDGDGFGVGIALINVATLHREAGELDRARACCLEALQRMREASSRSIEAGILRDLGTLDRLQGRLEAARARYEEALAGARDAVDPTREAAVLGSLGRLALDEGRLDDAREALTEGERLLRGIGQPRLLAELLAGRARLEVRSGRPEVAEETRAEAQAILEALGIGPDSFMARDLAEATRVE